MEKSCLLWTFADTRIQIPDASVDSDNNACEEISNALLQHAVVVVLPSEPSFATQLFP